VQVRGWTVGVKRLTGRGKRALAAVIGLLLFLLSIVLHVAARYGGR
jgi:hypothetical protein